MFLLTTACLSVTSAVTPWNSQLGVPKESAPASVFTQGHAMGNEAWRRHRVPLRKCQIPTHPERLQRVRPGCVPSAVLTAVSGEPALGRTGQKMGSGRGNPLIWVDGEILIAPPYFQAFWKATLIMGSVFWNVAFEWKGNFLLNVLLTYNLAGTASAHTAVP